jgi:hypothetical protein
VALAVLTAGCETFDPAPEGEIVQPSGGRWFAEDPIQIRFTEPIRPETLVVTIWPKELDIEGEVKSGIEPIADKCTVATQPCGEVGMALSDDDTLLTVTQGEAFVGLEGKPFILELAPGLQDRAGRTRKVRSWFDFQVSPACGGAPVVLPLESGVLALSSDLSAVVPGTYLRMYLDVSVDERTGRAICAGTVARMDKAIYPEPNATNADGFFPLLDDEGWAVYFEANVGQNPDGTYCFLSDPFDFDVYVLGVIRVRLLPLQLEATIIPGQNGQRDKLEGYMSAAQALLFEGESEQNQGAIGATLYAEGLRPDEVPPGVALICEDDPCDELIPGGGDCQLPYPYTPPAWCAAPAAE